MSRRHGAPTQGLDALRAAALLRARPCSASSGPPPQPSRPAPQISDAKPPFPAPALPQNLHQRREAATCCFRWAAAEREGGGTAGRRRSAGGTWREAGERGLCRVPGHALAVRDATLEQSAIVGGSWVELVSVCVVPSCQCRACVS